MATRTRADAVRNYERVVAAATEVMAEKGLDAGVPEIAARAGVGKGTVYRCFPTKEHLVAAVVAERMRWLVDAAERAAAEPDAWAAFAALLQDVAEAQAADGCLADGFGHVSALEEMTAAKARWHDALAVLIERAQAQGAMRDDVTTEDVRRLMMGSSHVLRSEGERDAAAWRRSARLLADALRAR